MIIAEGGALAADSKTELIIYSTDLGIAKIRLFIPIIPMARKDPHQAWNHRGLFQADQYMKHLETVGSLARIQIIKQPKLRGILPLNQALIVGFKYYIPRTERLSTGKMIHHASEHHTIKPDLDNFNKAASDALTGIIWRDDCLIVGHDPAPYKLWAEEGQEPGIEIIVRPFKSTSFNYLTPKRRGVK